MKIIHNTRTGHEYILLRTAAETNGELLEMEVTYPAHSHEPPAHFHPHQTEHFQLLSGELTLRMGGQLWVLKTGDRFSIPPNTAHSMWNSGGQRAVLHWVITPALQSERFFETIAGLANDGKTNGKGVPGLLQIALTMRYFFEEYRLVKPPFWVQKLVFAMLAPLALLMGYKPVG